MILRLTWHPNLKIDWSKFSQEEISDKYITPLVKKLENINIAEFLDSNDSAETITNLLLQNSEIFDSCTNNPFGLCIDYEHIRFAGPPLLKFLFELCQNFYANGSVCESFNLPVFKGKGAKANNKK